MMVQSFLLVLFVRDVHRKVKLTVLFFSRCTCQNCEKLLQGGTYYKNCELLQIISIQNNYYYFEFAKLNQ